MWLIYQIFAGKKSIMGLSALVWWWKQKGVYLEGAREAVGGG